MASDRPVAARRRRRLPGSGSYSESAYAELKKRILNNEMPPGAQILEQEVTASLGMSRTPVREALVRLEREGLLEIRPRHGILVKPISLDDMREVYEVLTAVEAKAAEVLARRVPMPDLKPLEDAVQEMEAAVTADDRIAFAEADAQFHSALVDLCGNHRLADIAHVHWNQTQRVRLITLKILPHLDISTKEHRALLSLIRSGAADEAREAHRRNRERGGNEILEAFARFSLHVVP